MNIETCAAAMVMAEVRYWTMRADRIQNAFDRGEEGMGREMALILQSHRRKADEYRKRLPKFRVAT